MGHEINVVEFKRKEKKPMFAIVRTGGKQYRVSPGDKIVVEKLAGEAGDSISLGDVLLAGEGSDLEGTDGLTVAAEIIAQAKGEKVVVFKKRRRHNYRRKAGHRQQHTIIRIVSIGGEGQQAQGGNTATQAPKKDKAAAPASTDIDESNVASSEGVVPADAGQEATQDVTTSTQGAAPAKGKAKKTSKA
jgi:large subunit ribosomal protein L21